MKRIPKSVAVAAGVSVLTVALSATPALAFMGIADTGDGVLAALLANATEALATAKSSLKELNDVREFGQKAFTTAKDAYELAKHSAQMAESGVLLAHSMRQFSAARFGTAFTQDLEVAFPAVAYWRQEAEHPLGLGRAYDPALANALKFCLADAIKEKDACQRLKGKSERERTEAMLDLMGIKASSARPAPTTEAEWLEQSCDDRFRDAMKEVESERTVMAQVAAKFTELRETCLMGPKGQNGVRSWGAFQQIADDAGRVSADLASFDKGASGDKAKADAAAKAKAKAEACAELERQQALVAKEMDKYSRNTDLTLKSLELCKIGEARARELRERELAKAEAEAFRTTSRAGRTGLSAGQRPQVSTGTGYNILEDGSGGGKQ